MEKMRCPYCHTLVRMDAVESEDGSCPECGAPLMGSMLFGGEPGPHDDPYENGGLNIDDNDADKTANN